MATIDTLREKHDEFREAAIKYGRVQMLNELTTEILKISRECKREYDFHTQVLDLLCCKAIKEDEN